MKAPTPRGGKRKKDIKKENDEDDESESFDINNEAYKGEEIDARKASKKDKIPVSKFFLGQKRERSITRKKSDIARAVDHLYKKNFTDEDQIRSYLQLQATKESVTDGLVELVKVLVNSKIINGNIVLTDKIGNIKLSSYICLFNTEARCFSNDDFYIQYLYVTLQDTINKEYEIFESDCLESAVARYVKVVSPSFDKFDKIKKGYYQDYNKDFFSMNLKDEDGELYEWVKNFFEKGDIENEYELGSMTVDDIEYNIYGDIDSIIIAKRDINYEQMAEIYRNQVIVKTGRKVEIGEKEVKIDKKSRYLDFKMFPTEFCPAFLILDQPIYLNYMFCIDFDYNDLFNMMMKYYSEANSEIEIGRINQRNEAASKRKKKGRGRKYKVEIEEEEEEEKEEEEKEYDDIEMVEIKKKDEKERKELLLFENICYWDKLDEFFNFLLIFGVTAKGIPKEVQNTCYNLYDEYYNIKVFIKAWGKNQMFFQRIIEDFWNSFANKINYDKLNSLYDKVKQYNDNNTKVINSEMYPLAISLFKRIGKGAQFINNQILKQVMNVSVSMQNFLFKFTKVTKKEVYKNTENELSELIKKIYLITMNNEDNGIPSFPVLLSPGAYRANKIINNKLVIPKNYLKDNIVRYETGIEKRLNIVDKNVEDIMEIMKDDNRYEEYKKILENSIGFLVDKREITLKEEEIEEVVGKIIENIKANGDNKLMNYLNKELLTNAMKKVKDNINVPKKFLIPYIKNLEQRNQEEEINNQIEDNNIDNEILKKQQEINNLMDKKSKRKTGTASSATTSTRGVKVGDLGENDKGEALMERLNEYLNSDRQGEFDFAGVDKAKLKTFLSRIASWYKRLLLISDIYDVKKKTLSDNIDDLIEEYPLGIGAITKIVTNSNIPALENVLLDSNVLPNIKNLRWTSTEEDKNGLRQVNTDEINIGHAFKFIEQEKEDEKEEDKKKVKKKKDTKK